MEFIKNTCEKFFFDKFKPSPIPILFIPFNQNDDKCNNCGNKYSETLLFKQKYCRECLLRYITDITDNFTYLDIHISTINSKCNEHETTRNEEFYTRSIKEWCKNCSIISYFKQIPTNSLAYYDDDFNFEGQNMIIESEKDCKFCGKLIYKTTLLYEKLKICSDCYPISYEFIISSTTEETIPIFYLPWWDTFYVCVRCKAKLLSGGANQKWCSYCFIIYCGCRYCLTTNIIFGLTCQTHCKKCKRVTPIFMDNTIVNIGSNEIDDFVYKKRNIVNDLKNIYTKDIDKYDDNPLNVYDFFKEKLCVKSVSEAIIEWIPYSRIKNLKEIAKGDFGIIYQATWLDGGISDGTGYSRKKNETVAIKRFIDCINHKKDLLNELKSYYQCYNEYGHIIRYYGITKDLETNEDMLVMKYTNMENLLISITRKKKLENVSKESEPDKINEKSHSKETNSTNSSNLREGIIINWIPYSQFKDIKEMAKGGYSIIYKATWLSNNETVILKRFINSKDIDKYFLNELKSSQYCYEIRHNIIKTYGFTKDLDLEDYILVMEYAKEGDLHNLLQKCFADITWNKKKLAILWQIAEGYLYYVFITITYDNY
ncbi:unnamed protein product [Rhizophagus irregularis]|nr:unnamed protein product [Rhizophagus irregularis]